MPHARDEGEDRLDAFLAIVEAHLLFVREPPFRGADGSHSRKPTIAKGVTLARAFVAIAREGAPGSVVRAILPQGPHAPPRAARRL